MKNYLRINIKECFQDGLKMLKTSIFIVLLYILLLTIPAGILTLSNGPETALPNNNLIGVFSRFLCYCFFPIVAIEYGRRSYIITRKIIGPNLIFLIVYSAISLFVFWGIIELDGKIISLVFSSFSLTPPSMAVAIVISLISGVITKLILKSKEKKQRKVAIEKSNTDTLS